MAFSTEMELSTAANRKKPFQNKYWQARYLERWRIQLIKATGVEMQNGMVGRLCPKCKRFYYSSYVSVLECGICSPRNKYVSHEYRPSTGAERNYPPRKTAAHSKWE